MSTNTLHTRIALKYDSYAKWTDDTKEGLGANLVLLPGELGICTIEDKTQGAQTAPTVLFKVGDGTTPFKALKWASALAADVYSWAKSETVELVEVEEGESEAKVKKQYLYFKTGSFINHSIDLSMFATDAELKATADRITAIEAALGLEDTGTGSVAAQLEDITNRLDNINTAINNLDSIDAGDITAKSLVKSVSQTDGKVTVTYGKLTRAELPELTEDDIPEIHTDKVVVADATTDGEGNQVAAVTLDTKLTAIDGEIKSIRDSIAGGVHFIGIISVVEGENESLDLDNATVIIDGKSITAIAGDVVIKGTQEYIYNGTAWEPLGDVTRIGSIENAIKDMDAALNASANEFVTGIVQVDGKITEINTARPTAENIEYGKDAEQKSITVKYKLDKLSDEIDAVEDKVDLAEGETITSKITGAIAGLKHIGDKTKVTDFVASVTQTDGKVTVTYGALPEASNAEAGIVTLGVEGGAATYNEVDKLSQAVKTITEDTIPAAIDRLDDIEDEYIRVDAGKLVMGKLGTQMIIFDCGSATDAV